MATIQQVIENSFKVNELSTISSEKLVNGLKILKKTRTVFIPVGLDNRLEKVTSIKHNKTYITIKTFSSELVIRTLDLKHLLHMFVIK